MPKRKSGKVTKRKAASRKAPKRKSKAKRTKVHHVSARLGIPELAKAGSSLELEVSNADGKLGTLVLGRGSLTWYPRNAKKGVERSWTRFAAWMDDE